MSSIYACPRDRSHQLMWIHRAGDEFAGYWCPSCIKQYTFDEVKKR